MEKAIKAKKEIIISINSIEILCIVSCLSIFMGAIHPFLTYISLFASLVCAVLIGYCSTKKDKVAICKFILTILVFQNFLIGLGARIGANKSESLTLLTQIPFLTCAIIWAIFRGKTDNVTKKMLRKNEIIFSVLILLLFVSLLIGRGTIGSIYINTRNIICFYISFEIAVMCVVSKYDIKLITEFFMKLSVILVVAGIILLIGGIKLYTFIGYEEVYIAKSSPVLPGALDGRFYTSLVSNVYVRMGSLLYEPINLAYVFSLAFLIALFGYRGSNSKKIMYICVTGIGLFLTFGKGGYLIAACSILFILLRKLFLELNKSTGIRISIFVTLFGTTAFAIWYYLNIGAAASNHFFGVLETWNSVIRRPCGYGLGTGGNMSFILNGQTISHGAGFESALMSFMYQLGFQGIIVFVLCVLSTRCNIRNINSSIDSLFVFLPFFLIAISILQDNTFTPQCIIPFMLFQGAYFRKNNQPK